MSENTYSTYVMLRHALSEANRDGIVQGQTDYALAEEGRHQIEKLVEHWKSRNIRFDHAITSPLVRARETAERICTELGVTLVIDDLWKERHHGEAQGSTYEQAHQWYAGNPSASPFEPLFGSGESEWEIHIRASKAVRTLVDAQPGKYLIVSHGGFLGAVLRTILGSAPSSGRTRPARFSFVNTGFAELRYAHEEARWYFDSLNSTPHLDR